eukprot:15451198-Alexandrium_andersonii.AAC.1
MGVSVDQVQTNMVAGTMRVPPAAHEGPVAYVRRRTATAAGVARRMGRSLQWHGRCRRWREHIRTSHCNGCLRDGTAMR